MTKIQSLRKVIIATLILLIIIVATVPIKEILEPIITGAAIVSTRLRIISKVENITCNYTLVEGWNLISIPCQTANSSVDVVLANLSGSYVSIHEYNTTDTMDHWKSYKPGLPEWVIQDLSDIDIKKGYWIRMNKTATLYLEGNESLPLPINLLEGWNLVGYPNNDSKNISSALRDISSNLGSVHAYNATDTLDHWKAYNPNIDFSLNDLKEIKAGWGYWFNMSSKDSWLVVP